MQSICSKSINQDISVCFCLPFPLGATLVFSWFPDAATAHYSHSKTPSNGLAFGSFPPESCIKALSLQVNRPASSCMRLLIFREEMGGTVKKCNGKGRDEDG